MGSSQLFSVSHATLKSWVASRSLLDTRLHNLIHCCYVIVYNIFHSYSSILINLPTLHDDLFIGTLVKLINVELVDTPRSSAKTVTGSTYIIFVMQTK